MKFGYSLLLGEFIDAEKIDNEDFKCFKIVCPVCKGPIYKAESYHEPQAIRYLSHYNRNKAAVDKCELKITTISKEDMQSTNRLSRVKNIEYLLSVLRDTILENECPQYPDEIKSLKTSLNKLKHSAGVQFLRYRTYVLCKRKYLPGKDEDISELFDEYIRGIKMIPGSFPMTSFSIEIHKRFASDIWKHVILEKTKDNFSSLMIYGYKMLLRRIETNKSLRELYDFEMQLHLYMRKLIDSPQDQTEEILDKMSQFVVRPPHVMKKTNLINNMVSEITTEMIGCLIRVPYLEIIKRNYLLEEKKRKTENL